MCKLLGPPDDTHRQQHNNNTYNSSSGTLPLLLLLLLHCTEVSEFRRPVRLMQRARVGGFHILFIPPATRARPKRNSCHRPASIDRIAHPSRNKKKQETRNKMRDTLGGRRRRTRSQTAASGPEARPTLKRFFGGSASRRPKGEAADDAKSSHARHEDLSLLRRRKKEKFRAPNPHTH